MAINKKLIHFNSYDDFNSKKLSANVENTQYTEGVSDTVYDVTEGKSVDILYHSICWIKDTCQIWTHGQLYNSSVQAVDIGEQVDDVILNYVTKDDIPTKTSQLTNDSGYVTREELATAINSAIVSTLNTEV